MTPTDAGPTSSVRKQTGNKWARWASSPCTLLTPFFELGRQIPSTPPGKEAAAATLKQSRNFGVPGIPRSKLIAPHFLNFTFCVVPVFFFVFFSDFCCWLLVVCLKSPREHCHLAWFARDYYSMAGLSWPLDVLVGHGGARLLEETIGYLQVNYQFGREYRDRKKVYVSIKWFLYFRLWRIMLLLLLLVLELREAVRGTNRTCSQ